MSAFSSFRRALWSVLAVIAVTLAMVAVPGSAQAAPGDGISGTVSTSAGPLRGIQVTACPIAGGGCGASVGTTGADGRYSVIGLAPGDYYVTFQGATEAYQNPTTGASVNTTAYLTQNYPNIIATTAAGQGTPVHVTLNQLTTGIDDLAVAGSTFSGTVTNAAGAPLVDIYVLPAHADGYNSGVEQRTDSAGKYTTAGLPMTAGSPPGTYHLVFLDYRSRYYVPQWYDNLLDTLGQHSTATPLVVTGPGTRGLNTVVMQRGGNISGVATANGTTPLANVDVTLFPIGSSGPGLMGGQTDSAGRFITQSVPPGSYKVGFIDYSGAHANQYFYYYNATTLASAATITVTAGQTKALGAVMANQRYITRVYSDLFQRTPDPAGLAGWTAKLDTGTPRIAVANAITYSTEYRSKLITASYSHYLGRTPDAGGLRTWLAAMGRGYTVSQMESGFVASAEYYARAGSTDAGWVTRLYADVLGRPAAPTEVSAWTARLRAGSRRDQVAMGFLLSTERLNTVVNGYYRLLLGRGVDPTGQHNWVSILQAGGRDEAIIGGIIASAEYYARA